MNAYNVVLSGGARLRYEAMSPIDAIDKALWGNRGQTVVRLYCGFDGQDAKYTQGKIGGMNYDIPAHQAVPKDAVKTSRRKKGDEPNLTFGFLGGITPTT